MRDSTGNSSRETEFRTAKWKMEERWYGGMWNLIPPFHHAIPPAKNFVSNGRLKNQVSLSLAPADLRRIILLLLYFHLPSTSSLHKTRQSTLHAVHAAQSDCLVEILQLAFSLCPSHNTRNLTYSKWMSNHMSYQQQVSRCARRRVLSILS